MGITKTNMMIKAINKMMMRIMMMCMCMQHMNCYCQNRM